MSKKRNKKHKQHNNNGNNQTSNVTTITPKSYSTFGAISNKKPHVYKGKKNETDFPEFIELCKLTQEELKSVLPKKLCDAGYTDVVIDDGFIYAKGEIPILLTAHMDTVHKDAVRDFYEYIDYKGEHIISSPQGIGGDDRCGIYMILEIIKDFKPSILFCEDEEIGGIGSDKFCKSDLIYELSDLKFLIELDRANSNDAVFYDCDNPEFTEFITEHTKYKETWGSFSDISNLAPTCRVAAVNLSCGYYHAHTLEEEVNVEEMLNTVEVVRKLLTIECGQFEYIETMYGNSFNYRQLLYGYDSYDSYYNRSRSSYFTPVKTEKNIRDFAQYQVDDDDIDDDDKVMLCISYYDHMTYEEIEEIYTGTTVDAAWFKFFKENPSTCWNHVLDYDCYNI